MTRDAIRIQPTTVRIWPLEKLFFIKTCRSYLSIVSSLGKSNNENLKHSDQISVNEEFLIKLFLLAWILMSICDLKTKAEEISFQWVDTGLVVDWILPLESTPTSTTGVTELANFLLTMPTPRHFKKSSKPSEETNLYRPTMGSGPVKK